MRKLTLALSTAALAISGAAFAQPSPGMQRAPQGDLTRAQAQQRAEAMFARMDANKDGTVNEADRAARKAAMFDRLDANRDGSITKAEMATAHAARADKRDGRKAQRADTAAAKGPAMTDAQKAERRDAMFARIDTDGNGAVSRAEFDAMQGMRDGKVGKRGGKAMARMDGAVDRQAFVARALERFDRLDADKNGVATTTERKALRDQWKANRAARQQG